MEIGLAELVIPLCAGFPVTASKRFLDMGAALAAPGSASVKVEDIGIAPAPCANSFVDLFLI